MFTYTGDPIHVFRDAVRWWCGDTNATAALLQDGEVDYSITFYPENARLAAALCLDALAVKFAQLANITVGEVSKQNGDRSKVFRERANDLRTEAGKLAQPFFGGQSVSEKRALDGDADAVQPPIKMGQFDNPLSRQFDGQAPDPADPVR